MHRPSVRRFATGLIIAVAYVVAAQVGFRFAFVAEQVTTVWPPTGIGLAALLLYGASLWPAIWVGAFVANAATAAPWWTDAVVATGNTLEAVAATWVLRHIVRFDVRLQRIPDVLALIGIAAAASTTLSATVGAGALCASGVQPWQRFGLLWREWWLGDAVGALVVAPAILTCRVRRAWSWRETLETGVLIAGAVLALHVVFGEALGRQTAFHPLEYVIFPFVIAAAVRRRQPTTSLLVLGASAVTIWHTVRGAGPFASAQVHESLILLQVFMAVFACTGLLLAAAIAEREIGERRRAAAYAVADVLTRAPDLSTAASGILRGLCENLQWQTGALWLLDPADRRLHSVALWSEPGLSAPSFERATREMALSSGVGLPGRVLESGKPVWIENVVHDANFPRGAAAREAGLRGWFGFPICLGTETLGVVECFNRTVVPSDLDLLRTMSTVGSQIGQFIGRKQAQGDREELLLREARARAEAESANRAKDEFLATLSHELRTPLNAIVGWTRMLLEGAMDARSSRHALEVIDRNAQLQSRLVADILDVSRIITGGLRLETRPVDLGSVIGAALDAVRPAAEARNVRLTPRVAGSGRVVHGDPHRLQQIVWNLLSNAVKFTEAGGTVTIEVGEAPGDRLFVRVIDDGAGIEPAFLPHVFERFRQGDGSASRKHGGLGLGLAIVRHLVELHGGTAHVESEGLGKGSTFTVVLPAMPLSSSTDTTAVKPSLRSDGERPPRRVLEGYRVLVVDDQEDARDLMATILAGAGALVDQAASAADALDRITASRPDVLLADIGLPGMDGYGLIAQVRSRDVQGGSRLPAAAITAYVGDVDRARVLAAGYDRHVPKPVTRDVIVSVVLAICPEPRR